MDAETELIIYEATTGFERLKNAYEEQADELEELEGLLAGWREAGYEDREEALTARIEQLEEERDDALLKVRVCEQALAEYDATAERYPGIEF